MGGKAWDVLSKTNIKGTMLLSILEQKRIYTRELSLHYLE